MIAKTALFPAIAAESPRKDDDRTERGGAGFGSLLEEQLRDPAAEAGGPPIPKAPAREGAHADAPTAAVLRSALEAQTPPTTGATDGDAPATIAREASTPGTAEATEDDAAAPMPPVAPANPPPAPQAPVAAAPLPIPLLVAPPLGADIAKASPGTDAPSTDEAKASLAGPDGAAMSDHVAGVPTRAPSRGAAQVAFAGRAPGSTHADAAPARAKIAEKADKSHPSPGGDMAAVAPPAIAAVPAHAPAPATDIRATADQAHAAADLSPGPRARTAMRATPLMHDARITAPDSDPSAREPGVEDVDPADASPLPPEAASGALGAEGPPAPEAPAQEESIDLPRDLSALRTALGAPPGGPPRAHAAAPAAPNATPPAAERPPQQKPSAEPARTASAHEAPRAAGSASTPTAATRPPTTPGAPSDNPGAGDGHAGADGRERQAAPERIAASDRRAPTSTTISDKVRPDIDARAERPVRTGSPEAAEPARGTTPIDVLPAAAPIVKDAPASPVAAAATAPASLRHEPVAPSVNVVTLAAATRSEVDIPELGRIVIAAERRRNRVDLEIHAAEPATVQLLQEKAPEMLHEVNRVANVAAVNVHQSKADDAGKPGASGGAPRGSDGSAGSGGHGARKEHRTPAEERSDAEITGPVASAAGRVRFVL